MATHYLFITGKIKWAAGLKNRDQKFGHYNCPLYVSKEDQAKLKEMKSEVRFKEDADGLYFKMKRDHEKKIKDKLTVFGPPRVFMTDPSGNDVELDPATVGNGSTVTAKFALYDTNFGTRGTRLEAVRVDNYLEYIPEAQVGSEEVPF